MGNVITLLHAEHLQSMDEVIGKMIRLCNPLSVTINDSRCLLLEKPALVKIVKELHYLESSLGSTDFQLTIIGVRVVG